MTETVGTSDTNSEQLSLVVSANFTAEPVDASLTFWLRGLQLPATVQHAPFDQVFQQLLDPASFLRTHCRDNGIGLLLVQLEKWLQQAPSPVPESKSNTTSDPAVSPGSGSEDSRIVQDFVDAVSAALDGISSQLIVCFCPSTSSDATLRENVSSTENAVSQALQDQAGVRVVTSASVLESYACEQIADRQGERIASMPYTPQFFSVLGTVLARNIYALTFPAHKVLVLDCDDTLWGGLCGEVGAQGVVLSEEYLALQEFAVEQRHDGKLICLASRNNESSVFDVFDQNTSMVLQRDDLTAWQINWGLKSENLANMAAKLGLGLNSFVFLDDDPMQCAEVRRRYPEVLALQVPKHGIADFCRHIWPLDPRRGTSEGSRRTDSYKEHVAREDVRASSRSFQQFLDGLELNIEIAPLREPDLARASELTYRTNQFNLTGRRLNEAEFRDLLSKHDDLCFGVRVSDRFGDYGLVGLLVAEPQGAGLHVPVMLLSCRSLGRGVEHRMVAHIGALAREHGAGLVNLHCVPTERNDPAREFLHKLGEVGISDDGSISLVLETDAAETVRLNPDATPQQDEAANPRAREAPSAEFNADDRRNAFIAGIPGALASADAIHEAVHGRSGSPISIEGADDQADSVAGSAAATDPVETQLMQAFAAQLGLSDVPGEVGFFELGGDSLQAMQILAQVSTEFGVELDPTLLFTTNFTISELAAEINFLREHEQSGAGT